MANNSNGNSNQGGTHEQHVKAGEQSHKNTDKKMDMDKGGDMKSTGSESSTRGGTHVQHVKAGQQSHKKN